MKTIYLSIIFLLLSLCFAMLFAVSGKYIKTINRTYIEQENAEKLLNTILIDFQKLKDFEIDYENCSFLLDLQNQYMKNNLIITDVSSRINKNFFPDSIITKYEQKIKLFEDEFFTEYGWMNSNHSNSKGQNILEINFPTNKSLYPYKNSLPLVNIYNVDKQLLNELFIMADINDTKMIDEFVYRIENKLFENPLDIQKLLKVNSNSLPATLFVTKTTFWKLEFIYDSKIKVTAVVCGIPDKNNGKIFRYDLIENIYKR